MSKAQGKKALIQSRPKNAQTLQRARRQRFTDDMAKLDTPEKDVLYEFVLDGFQIMPPHQNDVLLKYGHAAYKDDPIVAIVAKTGFMRGTFHGHYEVNGEVKSFLEEWANTYQATDVANVTQSNQR